MRRRATHFGCRLVLAQALIDDLAQQVDPCWALLQQLLVITLRMNMRALSDLNVDESNGWRTDAALSLRVFGRHRGSGGTPSLCQLLRAVRSSTGAADARDGLRYDPVHGTAMSSIPYPLMTRSEIVHQAKSS